MSSPIFLPSTSRRRRPRPVLPATGRALLPSPPPRAPFPEFGKFPHQLLNLPSLFPPTAATVLASTTTYAHRFRPSTDRRLCSFRPAATRFKDRVFCPRRQGHGSVSAGDGSFDAGGEDGGEVRHWSAEINGVSLHAAKQGSSSTASRSCGSHGAARWPPSPPTSAAVALLDHLRLTKQKK